ncbi:redoxin domain-containing protein [Algoriphagus namhaensis]
MIYKFTLSLILAVLCANFAAAQSIEDLTATDLRSGNSVKLGELPVKEGLILIAHSFDCPFSEMYANRLSRLVQEYSSRGFSFYLLNPSKTENAAVENLKAKISQETLQLPYFSDPEQVWTKFFNITKIPETILITSGENGLEVAYRGAFDNNPQAEGSVTDRYLERAINQVLKGQKPGPAQVRAMGCNVKTF